MQMQVRRKTWFFSWFQDNIIVNSFQCSYHWRGSWAYIAHWCIIWTGEGHRPIQIRPKTSYIQCNFGCWQVLSGTFTEKKSTTLSGYTVDHFDQELKLHTQISLLANSNWKLLPLLYLFYSSLKRFIQFYVFIIQIYVAINFLLGVHVWTFFVSLRCEKIKYGSQGRACLG